MIPSASVKAISTVRWVLDIFHKCMTIDYVQIYDHLMNWEPIMHWKEMGLKVPKCNFGKIYFTCWRYRRSSHFIHLAASLIVLYYCAAPNWNICMIYLSRTADVRCSLHILVLQCWLLSRNTDQIWHTFQMLQMLVTHVPFLTGMSTSKFASFSCGYFFSLQNYFSNLYSLNHQF